LLLKGGRVVDPSQEVDDTLDLLLGEAGVEALGARLLTRGATVVDVAGLVVCPGLIDLRAHLGEPGHEDRETVRTGTRAAAAGGFTAVCAMPGTDQNDQAGPTRALLDRARLRGSPCTRWGP
jgi:dihydroorotase